MTLCKQQNGAFQVCSGHSCASSPGTQQQFKWEFVGVSVDSTQLSICSSQWALRSLSCVIITTSELVLGSTSKIEVSGEVELYDLQFKAESVDLSSVLSSYTCHSVCIDCFGPSFTACEEFFPLIDLHTTKANPTGQSLSFAEGAREFRGKAYTNLDEYAFTGWFRLESSASSSWLEIMRFARAS
jgi:hypothetical protein